MRTNVKTSGDELMRILRNAPVQGFTVAEVCARLKCFSSPDTISSRLGKWASYGLILRDVERRASNGKLPPHGVARYRLKDASNDD